jgi:ABC-2 type transport system permease protein
MLSASFIMIFKQGNPINMVYGSSRYFPGGILFPVEVLPRSFQYLPNLLPITHAVRALRELLLAGINAGDMVPLGIKLIIFIAIPGP